MTQEKLIGVFNTLCQLQVSGYQNVSLLSGCLQLLKEMIEEEATYNSQKNVATVE